MRKAGDIWKIYQNNGHVQDVAETLGGAAVSATGQALFTDMTPEEIAATTLLGGLAAYGVRKPAAEAGFAIGRKLDKRFPEAQDAGGMLSISSPRGQEIYKRILTDIGGKEAAEADIILKLLKAKGNQNYVRKDGTPRGYIEGFLGGMGRNRSDNVAQAAVGFGAPFILGTLDEEESLNSTLK